MQADRQLKHYTKKTPTNIYSAPKHARQKNSEREAGRERDEETCNLTEQENNKQSSLQEQCLGVANWWLTGNLSAWRKVSAQ